jgi:hypothetical protein
MAADKGARSSSVVAADISFEQVWGMIWRRRRRRRTWEGWQWQATEASAGIASALRLRCRGSIPPKPSCLAFLFVPLCLHVLIAATTSINLQSQISILLLVVFNTPLLRSILTVQIAAHKSMRKMNKRDL